MKIIYLDIDGVLNTHDKHPNGYCGIHAQKVYLLNAVIKATGAKVILTSAWRYMILCQEITLQGFEYLLAIHGFEGDVIGHTPPDDVYDGPVKTEFSRGVLIEQSVRKLKPEFYVVIDDLDLDISERHPFIQTLSEVGLTRAHVPAIIERLVTK